MEQLSKEASQAKNEMLNRYCFLYENSFFILAQIAKEHEKDFKDLSNDIKSILDISFDNQILYDRERKYITLSMFHLLEEYMFGPYRCNKTELEKVVSDMKYRPSVYLKLKNDFIFQDSKIGVNRKDISMRILLELMSSFIKSQSSSKTVFVERCYDGLRSISVRGIYKDLTISVSDIKLKSNCLDSYFYINKYQNIGFGKQEISDFLPGYSLPVLSDKTLVSSNSFLFALRRLQAKPDLKDSRDIYFKYHEEIPWDSQAVCETKKDNIKRSSSIKPCNKSFYLNEEDIFYAKESFLQICPYCGYIVNIDGKIKSFDVRRRIEFRDYQDETLLLKRNILSELISLGGLDKANILVKSRNRRG